MTTAADKVSVDTMLADAISKMDALTKRMDALEVGEKKIIKGDDDDDKKSKSDSKASASRGDDDDDDKRKDDGTTAPKTKILDSEKGAAKGDAGFPPAKVKKGDAAKDDDGELEIKHGKEKDDSAKKADDDDDDKKDDAFPLKKKKDDAAKAKSDDDDDDKKDDAVKADAVADLRKQIASQQEVITRLQSLMQPRSDDEHAAFAEAQSRADAVFASFGERAPRPLEGEVLFDYRKRL